MKNVTNKKSGSKRSDSVSRAEFFAEFGTLLEDIRNNGLIVAEGVTSLRSELKAEIAEVRNEIVEVREELKAEIAGVREELKAEITGVREELRAEISGVREELKAEITGVREELKAEIVGVRREMRSGFLAVGESLELLHDEIKDIRKELTIVKERLTKKADLDYVASLEERVRRVEITMLKRKSIPA